MSWWGRREGQATVEWVALVALVGLLLGLAVVFTPAMRATAAAIVRSIACAILAGPCRRALRPCVLSESSRQDELEASLAVVRLGDGQELALERRSDGTVLVGFLEGGEVGIGGGIGGNVELRRGNRSAHARLQAEIGAHVLFRTGRQYIFGSLAAAQAFVRRYEVGRSAQDFVTHHLCDLCADLADRVSGRRQRELPPADVVYREAGADVESDLRASLGPLSAELAGSLTAALGYSEDRRRSAPNFGQRTYVFRLESSGDGALNGVVGGASLAARSEAKLEFTLDRYGRPLTLTLTGMHALGGRFDELTRASSLTDLLGRVRRSPPAERSEAVVHRVTLDLGDEDNARVASAFVAGLRPGATSPGELRARTAALLARLDADGVIDLERRETHESRDAAGGDIALGIKLGGHYEHVERGSTLRDAATRLPGGAFRQRDDCVASAPA